MLVEACKREQIDIILLNETKVKWTATNLDKIEKRLKSLGREITLFGTDSST